MQKKYINRNKGNQRLILIFAGWAMDWRPFRDISLHGYDMLVIWDYRDLTFNWKPYFGYKEVCLIAWSMGVFAASVTIHELLPRITKKIAINGTLEPVNDRKGIPLAVYHGTINALAPNTLRKFYRRMCLSAEQFAGFYEKMPKRSIADLAEELRAIETHSIFHVPQVEDWDLAVISRHDSIFPTQNQVNAWSHLAPVQFMDASHLPDFKRLIPRLIIDKDRVRSRFAGSRSCYSAEAVVQQTVARNLYRRFCQITSSEQTMVGNILEVGCGNGALTEVYGPDVPSVSSLRLWDIAGEMPDAVRHAMFEQCDAEVAIRHLPSASVSVIFSSSTIQWFNSPCAFFRECRRVLVAGGYLVVSSFIRGNLQEVTDIAGVGLQLPTAEGWRSMIPLQMDVLICDTGIERILFDSPRQVLEHLRDTGVNAVDYGRSAVGITRRLLHDYPRRDEDGKYPLTYRPIYMVLRKQDIP